jgi:hypothetical protein
VIGGIGGGDRRAWVIGMGDWQAWEIGEHG